ncbi:YihY/virulence factor BrkB family protein [Thiorhodovibrio frisius]|uniref:Putative membrane protein n=1 Tax=Thiorhodovibrio frisius TaxID=631362 RepID=H8Z817_9GAMM|nr:YihY/virulence factor BrkB family protein [Thiorhodovibrio frisius]EIC19952.1 putative membrane protein [Thiorhodovibrio frisius]WPL20681.1 ribonuclease BN/unknown domain fusion protein [Thiorhodovibrio frisius]
MIDFQLVPTRLEHLLWQTPLEQLPVAQRYAVLIGRVMFALGRDFHQGLLSLQAMSLVYTTLLSLVPLLAVSFSVLKGFGVHNQIEPWLLHALAPLGDQSGEIAQNLIAFVDKTNVKVLGSVGIGVLLYSVLSLIQKIEQIFNATWRIKQLRPFGERLSHYLSVLLIGPVLFFSAVGATASLRSNTLVQWLMEREAMGFLLGSVWPWLLPFLLISLAFTFIYAYVPNTRVQLRAAIIGALVAGLLWQTVGSIFATFITGSTRYAAIYSSLAILILFMMWIYIAWLIVLIGANIAFYVQNPAYLNTKKREPRLSNRLRERLALLLIGRIASDYEHGRLPPDADTLAKACGVPGTNIATLLDMLKTAQIIRRTTDSTASHHLALPEGFIPSRPPERISIQAVLDAVREYEEEGAIAPLTGPVANIETRIAAATSGATEGLTLKNLIDGSQSTSPEHSSRAGQDDLGEGTSVTST